MPAGARARKGPGARKALPRTPRPRSRPAARRSRPAPGRAGLSLRALVGLPTYNLPTLNHQRDLLSFFLDTTGRQELYLSPLHAPKARQLSHGEVPRSLRTGTAWDRAGRSIFFGKDEQGNENHEIYRIWLDGGRVQRLTTDPTSEKHALETSPDDRHLLVASNMAGKGGRRQFGLWRLHLKGGELEQLTDYANPVNTRSSPAHHHSPDGRWIAYSTNESSNPQNEDLYRMRADGSGAERIFRVREGSQEGVMDWSPDGRMLAIASDAGGSNRPGVLHLESREARWFGQEGRDEAPVEFSPDGRWLVTLSYSGVELLPHVYEVESGDELPIQVPGGSHFSAQFTAGSSSLVLLHTDVDVPNRILRYELKTRQLSVLFPSLYGTLRPEQLPSCETVRYRSFDGRAIEALLLRPRKGPGRRRGPALVEVHGGPTSQFVRMFLPYALFLASRGYTVLEPNVRGSTGYGVEFRDVARMDWGGGDLGDVAKGREFLAGLDGIDPARIGIFGGSYGGFMTYLATVKRPELWTAACAIVGISDLQLMWGESKEHFRYFLREQMGDPAANAALWRDRSAVHFAERLQAKLLMLHGANDPRCPVDQARVFRDRLLAAGRQAGKDFDYEEYTDEGHGSSDIGQKVRLWGRMVDYFDRTL